MPGSTASRRRAWRASRSAAGAGASPPFPPRHPDAAAARAALRHLVRRDPRQYGHAQARWTLPAIRRSGPWLRLASDASLSGLLARLGLSWQRARSYVYSPDPAYFAKLATVAAVVAAARDDPELVTLYLDEVTFYRQPTLAGAWAATREQPRAARSHQADTPTRVVAALERRSGRVVYRRRSRITVATLVDSYRQLCAAYPHARRLYIVQDNWPVHWHPDLLVALEPQRSPWPGRVPGHWAAAAGAGAERRWGHLALPIQLVPLPTYASWTNPIEKLWRQLRQEVLHLHRLAGDLAGLRAAVDRFLDRFAAGSPGLLRYVGLAVPD